MGFSCFQMVYSALFFLSNFAYAGSKPFSPPKAANENCPSYQRGRRDAHNFNLGQRLLVYLSPDKLRFVIHWFSGLRPG